MHPLNRRGICWTTSFFYFDVNQYPLAPVLEIEQVLSSKDEIVLEISIDIAYGYSFAPLLQGYLFDHDSNKSQVMDEDTSKALRSNDIRNAHAHKPANQASNQTLELFKCCTQLSGDDPKHC